MWRSCTGTASSGQKNYIRFIDSFWKRCLVSCRSTCECLANRTVWEYMHSIRLHLISHILTAVGVCLGWLLKAVVPASCKIAF
jgi:hypothetical protein